MIHSHTTLSFSDCRTAAQGATGRAVGGGWNAEATLGSLQTAQWPSTLRTSTFRAIICGHLYDLKTVHYTFLLLPIPKEFGLVRHRLSKLFLSWATISILPIPSIKAKKHFVYSKVNISFILSCNPWGIGTFSSHKKKHTHKNFLKKKREREGFFVSAKMFTSKIAFNWKLISRSKCQTRSRKFSFNHKFTVILVPSTIS